MGAAALVPLARLLPAARAAGVFADEATYLFDPGALRFDPDPATWVRAGELTPIAVPDRGLGAAGVSSTLSYTHFTPPFTEGQGAALRAQLSTPPVPDDSGAWLDDAISTRLTLDDGTGQVTVVPARDPATGQRELRVENLATRLRLPFPWDNGYANIVDIERRPDGPFALTATNLDPAADGLSNTIAFSESYASSGRPLVQFAWDREGRSQSDSSCWVRVSTAWAGKSAGGIVLQGDQALVFFLEGTPDRPIIIGSIYNSERLEPFPQPADPQSDVWTLRTSSGGGFHNEFTCIPEAVRFDRGQQVYVFRSKDDGPAKVEMRFLPLDPPFLWGFGLEAKRTPSLFPIALARSRTGELASVVHVELQIGDMTGSRTYRVRGSDSRISSG
jgi:Type VI secretion system/phage-baseplate injector OB domain